MNYFLFFIILKLVIFLCYFFPDLRSFFFLFFFFYILKFYVVEVHQHFLTSLHSGKCFSLFCRFFLYCILIYPKYTANSGLYYWHTEFFFVFCGKVFECTMNAFLWVICLCKSILILLLAEMYNFRYADFQSSMILDESAKKRKRLTIKSRIIFFSCVMWCLGKNMHQRIEQFQICDLYWGFGAGCRAISLWINDICRFQM